MIIGITGGTGSGKSTVCNELKKRGCVILDADAIYAELTLPGASLVKKLAEEFGADIAVDGVLDRRKLSKIAFASEVNTAKLNAITHRAVQEEMEAGINANKGKTIVLDVPLMFESGTDSMCDEVWTVTAPIEDRIARVMSRDGISREEVEARIMHQMSDEERIKLSDLVIVNDTEEHLKEQLDTIITERLADNG